MKQSIIETDPSYHREDFWGVVMAVKSQYPSPPTTPYGTLVVHFVHVMCADVLSDKLLCIIPVIELTSFVIQSLKDFNGLKLRVGLTQAHLASYPGQVASYPGPT